MLGFRPEGTGERAPVRYFKFDCPKQADDVGECLRVPVRTTGTWRTSRGKKAKSSRRKRTDGVTA